MGFGPGLLKAEALSISEARLSVTVIPLTMNGSRLTVILLHKYGPMVFPYNRSIANFSVSK